MADREPPSVLILVQYLPPKQHLLLELRDDGKSAWGNKIYGEELKALSDRSRADVARAVYILEKAMKEEPSNDC